MRVICIREPKETVSWRTGLPFEIRVGSFYTVIEIFEQCGVLGYRLLEDKIHTYNTKYFEPLSSIDETEFERNYKLEPATQE